jgi:hypothetical protein
MIKLTEDQRRELAESEPLVFDPRTQRHYVLVPKETYDRIKGLLYDDGPWTDDEMDLLAEEAGELLDSAFHVVLRDPSLDEPQSLRT